MLGHGIGWLKILIIIEGKEPVPLSMEKIEQTHIVFVNQAADQEPVTGGFDPATGDRVAMHGVFSRLKAMSQVDGLA